MNQTQMDPAQAAAAGTAALVVLSVYLVFVLLIIAGMWKTLSKAGQPGWAAIIPIYNVYVLLKAAGKPGWWVLLFLIPLVNVIIAIMTYLGLVTNFGKGAGYAVGLLFLPFIFFPMPGFGDAQYQGAKA